MYVLKNLPKLQERPRKLQEKVFEKLFSEAEVAKLTPEEMRRYEESQKVYWDNYAIMETAKKEGRDLGKQEGREETILIIKKLRKGQTPEEIAQSTNIPLARIL